MKKNTKSHIIVILFLLSLVLGLYFFFPRPPYSIMSFEKRAVWISYEDLAQLDFSSREAFREDFQEVLENVKKYQNNTVIVHVRAFSDALYESKLYPVSQVMTHQTTLDFDPLKEMIELSHQEGLLFEAWINPYRICTNQTTYQQFQTSSLSSWLDNQDLTIKYGTYKYILNPASQKVREYIVEGVKEIVTSYSVDGIHFDDYFYMPGTEGNTTENERLDYVNMLIQDVYYTVKSADQNITFGVAPQGNYENCMAAGADIETWLKEEGYIDYLMPQLYWTDQHGVDGDTAMFTQRAKLYAHLKRHRSVQLYAGLALYRSGKQIHDDQGWSLSTHNISDQVQILSENGYQGYSLFTYSSLKEEGGQKEMDELLRIHP